MLTTKMLEDMKPGIFAQGEVSDGPEGANMANTGKVLKWVADRGSIDDWAIYIDNPYIPNYSYEAVAMFGDKIHNRDTVKRLVACTEDALARYRD